MCQSKYFYLIMEGGKKTEGSIIYSTWAKCYEEALFQYQDIKWRTSFFYDFRNYNIYRVLTGARHPPCRLNSYSYRHEIGA